MDALNYNEKKVQQGKAACIAASGYLLEHDKMNFYQKLEGFENLNRRNDRATTKTIHVSLNFDPSEKLTFEQLNSIAETYMQKIGFGEQPYLVYRHDDAGHPHVHIVSTTIKEDGTRINTHNLGRNQSETARKEIEKTFSLVPAEKQKRLLQQTIAPVDVEKAVYGKTETKRSISNVVGLVFGKYKFTSLPEFNAALKQFNVVADRGKEDGRIYKHRGLVYRLLDAGGNKIGVPIKASSIACRPILDNLEKKFVLNELAREPFKASLKNAVDEAIASKPASIKEMVAALEKKQVFTVLRQNAEGRLYGITFVDNRNRCVFNGSDLGKQYSMAGLQAKIAVCQQTPVTEEGVKKDAGAGSSGKAKPLNYNRQPNLDTQTNSNNILEILLTPEQQYGTTPYQLLNKKRKKKKKKLNQ